LRIDPVRFDYSVPSVYGNLRYNNIIGHLSRWMSVKELFSDIKNSATGVDPLSWTPHRWSWRDTRWQTKRSGIRRSSSDRWSGW
jgi:hypothetical protein